MGRKIFEIPLGKKKGFQRSLGVMHGAVPLSPSLERPSVWGVQKCWGVTHGAVPLIEETQRANSRQKLKYLDAFLAHELRF